jgi:ferritin-like metal-binding protein YciE
MLSTMEDVLKDHIKDLYNAENQLVKALPKMAKAASTASLSEAFTHHLAETKTHVERLEKVASLLDFKPTGKKCAGMEGLIKEGQEAIDEEGAGEAVDFAIIAAAQKVEHYEISAYGTAKAIAEQLDRQDVVELLEATLNEEKAADKALTEISMDEVFPVLLVAESEEGDEDDDE